MTLAEQLTMWADKLRDVSAMGYRYANNVYDKHNYEQVRDIAMRMMALANGDDLAEIEPLRATVFAHPTPLSGADAAVIDENGRILLIQRTDNQKWAMPGGALEVGETAAAGAMREAFEETGVSAEPVAMVGVWDSWYPGIKSCQHIYNFVFLGRPLPNTPAQSPTHPQETMNMGWFLESDLPENVDAGHAQRIHYAFQVRRGEKRPYFDIVAK